MTKSTKKAKADLPELVTVMVKLVERLEALEKKTDLVLSRISSLPAEVRQASASSPHAVPSQQAAHIAPRERPMYQAICADCCKSCEVPFRPTAERPVYCKACFTIRKAGHVPQDPDHGSTVPQAKRVMPTTLAPAPKTEAPKEKKQTPKKAKPSGKKKKK